MADNKKRASKFSQNAKLRVIIVAVAIVAIIAVAFVIWRQHEKTSGLKSIADVSTSPNIQSLPGAGNPSENYVESQNIQNVVQAQQARKEATSFVPTITRPSFAGSAESFVDNQEKTNVPAPKKLNCAIKKVVYMYRPNPANCTVDNLRLARSAGVTAEELLCQSCSCPALRLAGYSAGELKNVGYSAKDLRQCGYQLQQLMAAGFDASALKAAGFTPAQLKAAGFTAGQLLAAGFTPTQIKAAGYAPAELQAAGITATQTDCSVAILRKERNSGTTATQLRQQGCGLAALKAAGYTAAQLKTAGFSAAELKGAGFNAKQLKAAGFSAQDLQAAGFTAKQLQTAGFTSAQIRAAESTNTACSVAVLRKARMNGVSVTALRNKGCGLAALKSAGYTAAELRAAGFSAKQLKAAGFSAADLKAAGFSAAELKAAGFSAKQLKAAGYNAADLKAAGFTASQLKTAGFTAAQLKAAGFSARQLRSAGFSASEMKAAGFSAADLRAAGFNAGELKDAGFTAAQLKAAGFSARQLKAAGFSATQLKAAGYSLGQLKSAGYTKGDLLRAGYTAGQAGYNTAPSPTEQVAAPKPVEIKAVRTDDVGSSSAIPPIDSDSPAARLREIQKLQQEALDQQQRRDLMQQEQGQMSLQAQKLMAEWSNNSTQAYQEGVHMQPPAGASVGATVNKGAKLTGPVIKAGTVMFAVLDTAINSDEKSPILARIVTGELKGSKLIGNFTRVNKKVLIKFNLINVPRFIRTFSISAVAIDPNTARTAVAGYVNNHYLLRYGTLFASAFVEGLAQGISQSGTTQDCNGIFCRTTYQDLSPGEYIALGLGNVGTQYANVMAQNFNTPPTIKIAGGTGIGILFTSDVTVPQPLPRMNSHA